MILISMAWSMWSSSPSFQRLLRHSRHLWLLQQQSHRQITSNACSVRCLSTSHASLTDKIHEPAKHKRAVRPQTVSDNAVPLIVELSVDEGTAHRTTTSVPNSEGSVRDFNQLLEWCEEAPAELPELNPAADAIPASVVSAENLLKRDDQKYVESVCLDEDVTRGKKLHAQTHAQNSESYISEAASQTPCSGCGAKLHCQDPSLPGYIQRSKFKTIPRDELRNHFCHRCQLMRHYEVALDVSVNPEEYTKIISKIRDVYALTVLIVDVTDMSNSLIKGLPKLIGRKRPMFVVGNKVDLVYKDDEGYLSRLEQKLELLCREEGLYRDMYVNYLGLVSAKTGYGIENFITKLFERWSNRGHVYILGCTNVGKSSLFNRLLMSDYCKAGAQDYYHRATTSAWPGTTLDLLQFPILTPVKSKLYDRIKRLRAEQKESIQEAKLKKHLKQPDKWKTAPVKGKVGQSFLGKTERKLLAHHTQVHGYEGATYSFDPRSDSVQESGHSRGALRLEVLGEREPYDADLHDRSHWCFDTPGVVNPQQVINRLTQEEISVLSSKSVVKPRMFVMKPTQVMFVSGLGRLDYIKGPNSIQVAVFAANGLPIHLLQCTEADDFYRENIGTAAVGIPLGDRERLWKLPALVGQEFVVHGSGWDVSAADILLSSIGWVAVTGGDRMRMKFRAYTPGGAGCGLREPALLPFAIRRRGRRVPRSSSYELRSAR